MSTKHTPGPWKIGEYRQIIGGDGKVLSVSGVSLPCGCVPDDDVSYANARLIAAAPDLLEAAKAALDFISSMPGDMGELEDQLATAIDKAEGA